MKCGKCIFSVQLSRENEMILCLVDAKGQKPENECHMPTVAEKQKACSQGKIVKHFEKNRDIVRAALAVCTGDMSEEEAVSIVKVIYGRDKL